VAAVFLASAFPDQATEEEKAHETPVARQIRRGLHLRRGPDGDHRERMLIRQLGRDVR
jgi:hypothetical protein